MKKIGLDVGDKRIGIAISDMLCMIASARESYVRKDEDTDLKYFAELAKAEGADAFVVGLPKNMDGTEGPRAVLTREFGDKLQSASGIKVIYQDERLSTVAAERMLISADVRRDKRKKVIDKVAAAIILQNFLDGPLNR